MVKPTGNDIHQDQINFAKRLIEEEALNKQEDETDEPYFSILDEPDIAKSFLTLLSRNHRAICSMYPELPLRQRVLIRDSIEKLLRLNSSMKKKLKAELKATKETNG